MHNSSISIHEAKSHYHTLWFTCLLFPRKREIEPYPEMTPAQCSNQPQLSQSSRANYRNNVIAFQAFEIAFTHIMLNYKIYFQKLLKVKTASHLSGRFPGMNGLNRESIVLSVHKHWLSAASMENS